MTTVNTLGKVATTVSKHGNNTYIKYHSTDVVIFDDSYVKLDTGGYKTVTTKRRMNQASNQFSLGFQVFQAKKIWYVVTPNGETVAFGKTGISFPRGI